ncbi:MAG: L,D-transpeptidase [Polyangia bacterium]
MAAKKKPNKKRRPRKPARASRIKTMLLALSLGGLSAAGLWRCLGGEAEPAAESLAPPPVPEEVDLGEGVKPDPTLINERELLRAEKRSAQQEPEAPSDEREEPESEEGSEPIAEKSLEDLFPLHGVAYHFHTQIRSAPEPDARVIGYARRGTTFRLGENISTEGCRRGWHELSGGGYVCDGAGVTVDDEPVGFAPSPPPASLDRALPYDYMYARKNGVPEYWRIPTAEEIERTEAVFERIERLESGEYPSSASGSAEDLDRGSLDDALARAAAIAADGGAPDGGVVVADAGPPPAPPVAGEEGSSTEVDAGDGGAADPYELPRYVHLRMAKGYYVSIDGVAVSEEGDAYRRTVRGRYIPKDSLYPASPSEMSGVLLGDELELPLAFVVRGGVSLLRREEGGDRLLKEKRASRYTALPYLGELKRRGRRYAQVGEDLYVLGRTVAVARRADPPEELEPGERWIDIDLSEQVLVAYEDELPVFATLISSGREGYETPSGEFRIYGKHVSITMDDPEAGEEAYSIEDVPWTQYFEKGFALHAAFWHDRFGRVRSHGCVNLSPADAHRLFFWTTPDLPDGYHGVVATRDDPGTKVVIHQ